MALTVDGVAVLAVTGVALAVTEVALVVTGVALAVTGVALAVDGVAFNCAILLVETLVTFSVLFSILFSVLVFTPALVDTLFLFCIVDIILPNSCILSTIVFNLLLSLSCVILFLILSNLLLCD